MACDHKRSHLGVDFGNFQQYLCMHSTHKNAVCYYSLEIISLIWLPMAANYAMLWMCSILSISIHSIHMYCVKFTLCPRDLVLARKHNVGIKNIASIQSLNFLSEINRMTCICFFSFKKFRLSFGQQYFTRFKVNEVTCA